MAHALVGSQVESTLNSGGAAQSATKTGATAGNGLIIIITWEGESGEVVASVTCPGETVDLHAGLGAFWTDIINARFASIKNIAASGDKTVTVNYNTGPDYSRVYLLEYSGQNVTQWLDVQSVSGSDTLDLASSVDNCLTIAVSGSIGGEPAIPSGYTEIGMTNDLWYKNGAYKLDAGVAGTKTITFSPGGNVHAAHFRPAGISLTKKFRVVLVDRNGTPRANLTNLQWAWWDQPLPQNFTAPLLKGSTETTAANGTIEGVLTGTSLAAGAAGFLLVTNGNGSPTQDPSPIAFARAVAVIEE